MLLFSCNLIPKHLSSIIYLISLPCIHIYNVRFLYKQWNAMGDGNGVEFISGKMKKTYQHFHHFSKWDFDGSWIHSLWKTKTCLANIISVVHDDVIKWEHFPRYWPFVQWIYRSTMNSPHKGQWRGALMFSLICAWINSSVNNREAGDMRRQRAHSHVSVMGSWYPGNAKAGHQQPRYWPSYPQIFSFNTRRITIHRIVRHFSDEIIQINPNKNV